MSTAREEQRSGRSRPVDKAPASRSFRAPRKSLEALDASSAASLIEAAADIALVLDRRGVIQDLSMNIDDLPAESFAGWIGQPLADVVTVESRPKVDLLLAEGAQGPQRRWRHLNHPVHNGSDLPVLYAAAPLGTKGRRVVFGRDMRALADVQQRLVDAQHTLERDYWRLRQMETRYRVLFDLASEAILIVDAATLRIIEANPAAAELLATPSRRLVGASFPVGLADKGARAATTAVARVRSSGRSEEVRARASHDKTELVVMLTPFMQENTQHLLVRMRAAGQLAAMSAHGAAAPRAAMAQAVELAPDGFVVTDLDGRVLLANAAFVELTQLAGEEPLKGQSLDRWLGRPGVDLSVMLAALRQQGSVRLFATTLRGEHGTLAEVEISGVAVPDGEPPCLGFTVRHIGRRLGTEPPSAKSAPRSVDQLTQLVGRMPLKDLVRESTDLIEQLCIEAALKLTQDNRASAAEMLGLSRQSLYVKLRRYGLGDLG